MKPCLACVAACLPLYCLGAGLPDPYIPEGVGVNIHFVTGQERDLDMIKEAGFRFIRMDFAWDATETKRGEYRWEGYDELVTNLRQRGLRAIFILDYSNPLYEQEVASTNPITGQPHKTTASPQHPDSVGAFARWAGAAAKHYQDKNIIWEIWNEPNIHFWSPKPDAGQYATLALATCKAVREQDPKATIVAPASSGFPWKFMETFFRAGALEFLDAVTVHPYRDYRREPETAAADYDKLRDLIRQYAPAERKDKIQVISGEWGYATHTKGVSLETQAAFAVRQQLANLLHAVRLSIWYDWKNDGPDPSEREHNFGVVTADLKPKPAYVALQTMTRELNEHCVARRFEGASDQDYLVLFENTSAQQKLAAWTCDKPHSQRVRLKPLEGPGQTGVSGDGKRFQPKFENGNLVLELNALPQYIAIQP